MKIKLYAWSVGFALAPLLVAPEAQAAAFSQLYGFGDSLVDTGNLFELTQAVLPLGVPQSPPYANGRFSNGPLWIEGLADVALAALHPDQPGESVTEPGMAFGLIMLSGLGLNLTRRR
ncbi:hypothetical protein [Vasconcelosia minhoensis]|uniref:hypothetical protein n=1 Tax=Vasconcelosia minhoensis TaxID=3366354 RepID=UPI001D149BE5|nr:hypothetical protein [Romeria gracilis]